MKKDRISIIAVAAFLAVIFVLVFFSIKMSSLYLVLAACLLVSIFIFAAFSIYMRYVHLRCIKEMTQELTDITHSLEERDYSHYSSDSSDFYSALSSVKQSFFKREAVRKEMLEIAHYIALNMEFDKALQELMPKLAELTRSNCCAFYSVSNASRLSLKHSIGFGKNIYKEFDLNIGEGFIGHLSMQKNITVVYEVPDDTIYMVRTFLGKIKPRNLMVVPIFHQEQINGVLVCASINNYTEENLNSAETLRYYLGVAVGNGINAEKNKRLTNELAFQNKLIQNQHEEMRSRLKDKELLITHLVDMIDEEIVYVLDKDYKVLYWDNRAVDIYGLSREETLHKHIDKVHGELGWSLIEDALKNMPQEENKFEHCTWIVSRDGKRRRFELCFSQISDKEALGLVAKVKELGKE